MFQSTFWAENNLAVVFHSENLLAVFKISKTLHLILKWARNDSFARRVVFIEDTVYKLKYSQNYQGGTMNWWT